MGGGDFVRIFKWRSFPISAFCSQHRLMYTWCVMHQFFCDGRFFIFIFIFPIFLFFFKQDVYTQNFHIPAFKCVETVVTMYCVSTCNEGECGGHPVQKGSPHRQESLVSPPEGSLYRSATGARSLGRSTWVFEL